RHQCGGAGQGRLRRSRQGRSLSQAQRFHRRHRGFHPPAGSGQRRLRPDRRRVRRGGQTRAVFGGRRLAAARRGGGSGRGVRAEVTARLAGSAKEIGAARWNAAANPERLAEPHPFTSYEFFAALEESGSASAVTGWQPCHLLADDGLMPLYLKSHSYGEYVFDHAWAEALERAGGDYYPKLQCSVPFTPVTGPRLLAKSDQARRELLALAAGAVKQLKASSLHITFPTQAEWKLAGDAGYLLRTGQQFHWENRGYDSFDQFLGELSSSKRKNLRKERASVREAGITFDWLTGADITEAHWDHFFGFYMDTGGRKWGTPYL